MNQCYFSFYECKSHANTGSWSCAKRKITVWAALLFGFWGKPKHANEETNRVINIKYIPSIQYLFNAL